MQILATIILLLFASISYAQNATTVKASYNIFQNIDGLTHPDSVSVQNMVGHYVTTNGFYGYAFDLDSSMKFLKKDHSCQLTFTTDNGTWSLKNNSTLIFKSLSETLYFDIVKYDDYYFLIQPNQRSAFVDALKATKLKLKNVKPFTIGDRIHSVDYLVADCLLEKYYGRELEEL